MSEPLYSACPELSDQITELVEEWCEDNDIDYDEVWEDVDSETVFFHDAYEFDGE